MKVTIHKHFEVIDEIFPEWEQLNNEFYDFTVFQSVEWMKIWWDLKENSREITPYIVEISKECKTIGIIPLYLSSKDFAKVKFRILRPIGVAYSNYLLPILSKKYLPEELIKIAMDKIYKDCKSWDCIHWGDIPKGSVFEKYLNKLTIGNQNKLIDKKEITFSPCVMLHQNLEKVKNNMSKSFLKGILYYERKLKREGDLQYHRVIKEQDIEPMMNMLFKFHEERWKLTDTPSIYKRNSDEKKWLMNIVKSLFNKGILYLTYLKHNDEIIAIELGMADAKTRYLLMGTMNPNFSKYPIGHIIVFKMIEEACIKGYEEMDFLSGVEPYKQKWGPINKKKFEYNFYNNSMKSSLFKLISHTYYSKQFIEKSFMYQFLMKSTIRSFSTLIGIKDKFN